MELKAGVVCDSRLGLGLDVHCQMDQSPFADEKGKRKGRRKRLQREIKKRQKALGTEQELQIAT